MNHLELNSTIIEHRHMTVQNIFLSWPLANYTWSFWTFEIFSSLNSSIKVLYDINYIIKHLRSPRRGLSNYLAYSVSLVIWIGILKYMSQVYMMYKKYSESFRLKPLAIGFQLNAGPLLGKRNKNSNILIETFHHFFAFETVLANSEPTRQISL